MNEVATRTQDNPFSRAVSTAGSNVGAIAIESERAIAEAQGQLIIAKKFPRNVPAAIVDFLDACKSMEFAQSAFYSVTNRGTGPSIRFAEEAARNYGNFEYGHRELSRTDGKSEIEVYAWDKEKNNRSIRQITVHHVMDRKDGPSKITDQSSIDNRIANVASKQMRGRILALMPKHMIAAGIAECKKTLAGGNDKPLSQKIIGLCAGFAKYGVTTDLLAKHLGHSVDGITLDEFADLIGIGNALKDGRKVSEFFDVETKNEEQSNIAQAINEAAKKPALNAPAAKQRTEKQPPIETKKEIEKTESINVDEIPHDASEFENNTDEQDVF